ncbi:MAG: hypothetical protein WA087_02535 [Candidatus Saccharimonadales bacterium]
MKKQNIKQTIGAALASLGLVVGLSGGMVGAQTGTIDTTGPDSDNEIQYETETEVDIENDNNLTAANSNMQSAETAEAEVEDNTTGGDAETGSASNESSFTASVTVDNSAGTSDLLADFDVEAESFTGSIENTGPDSDNEIEVENEIEIDIENDNNLSVVSTNVQRATSGDAEVEDNTTGGDAITGDASNESSTSITFKVTN